MTFVSYSQNLEDVMLWRALKHIEQGFYVDVGANDPMDLSVTYAFYQRGWHGINIDPVTYDALCRERTRDINLDVAAGSKEGEIIFYEASNSALSTSDHALIDNYKNSGQEIIERKVRTLTLNQILDKYADAPIHFMNIDVEGAEFEALRGLDLAKWRPWILLIEATVPTTRISAFEEWEPLVLTSGYNYVYFDGLNRFYVAVEHQELEEAFKLPPNIFDQYILANQHEAMKELEAKESVIQSQFSELAFKEKIIQLQQNALEAREKLEEKENIILAQNEVLNAKSEELEAKEKIIQHFRSSYFFWFVNGPFRWVPKIHSIANRIRSLRNIFLPKIGVLEHYRPRPLYIPKKYLKQSPMSVTQTLPSISIVTPSYGQGEFIARTVKSVLDQDYPRLEYIVQDGNSKDSTLQELKPFIPKFKHFESRADNGQAHAINLGFQYATGEIMAYLNADDILLPGSLEYVASYFSRHPEVDVVYGHRVIINNDDQEIGRWILPPHDREIIFWADYIPQETLFWRRSIWEKSGGMMDETFRFALDWELIVRFHNSGARFVRLPRFLGAFRLHASQKTSAQMNSIGQDEMSRIRKSIHGHDVGWEEIKKNIKSYLIRSIMYHRLYQLGILRY